MYDVMRNIILSQTLPMQEIQRRIDVFFAEGKLTEAEKAELEALAFENQTTDAERAELTKRVDELAAKVSELEARVAALEGEEPGEYPEWKPWDGVSDEYQPGAIVWHNDKLWLNVLENMQNVWEPGVADERYWVEYTE
ncbi:MAG: hypothetical protein Q4A66_02355 [Eubacteriales bacterium]|nr:hypothetical protein [Eubacteriales bacterium]